jgi:2-dehydropantoate 2-reductase
MRVAIVGVGAIGGALAGLVDAAGNHEITLCTRRPLPPLAVNWPDATVHVKACNTTNPEQAAPVDWVIVATKTYDAESAARWFPALCANGAPVAVVQNGVEHRERFLPYVAADRLLPVIIDLPVERRGDGDIHVRGAGTMKTEDSKLGENFASLFAGSPIRIELTADLVTAAWSKLCINAAGVLCALAQQPTRVLWSDAMSQIVVGLVEECVAVGRAEGANLDDAMSQRVLDHYHRLPADSVNSLLADRLAGRRMEVDARNGVIVRKGEKHGIPTPLNRMAVALLEADKEK